MLSFHKPSPLRQIAQTAPNFAAYCLDLVMSQIQVQKINSLHGHKDCIYALSPGPAPELIYSAGGDGLVAEWDLSNPEIGKLVAKVPNSVYALSWVSDTKELLVGQNYEGVHRIDVTTREEKLSVKLTRSAIFDIQNWKDTLYVACGDGVLILLTYPDLVVKKHVKASDKSARTIAINPVKGHLAVGYSDNRIRIFQLDDMRLLQEIEAHNNSIFSLRYTPDAQFLLSGSRDAHLKFWNVDQNYALEEAIVAHMYAINHISFSPNKRYFATASMDKSVKVWDLSQRKLLKVLDKARHAGHGTSVNKLVWTDYASLLVSASDDRTLSVWDIRFPSTN